MFRKIRKREVVDFPIYSIQTKKEYVVVSGGGGKAKSGVANGITLYRWSSNLGTNPSLEKVFSIDPTGDWVKCAELMLSDQTIPTLICASGNKIVVISLTFDSSANKYDKKKIDTYETVSSTGTESSILINQLKVSADGKHAYAALENGKIVGFAISAGAASQKSNSSAIITLSKIENMNIETEKNEATNGLDCNEDGSLIGLAARSALYIFAKNKTEKNGSTLYSLLWKRECHSGTQFRGLCFCSDSYAIQSTKSPSSKDASSIITSIVEIGKNKRTTISQLSINDGKTVHTRNVLRDQATALSIGGNGKILGVAFGSGAVAAYDATTFSRIVLDTEAHPIFVTDVAFGPISESRYYPLYLLSVSADRTILYTLLPSRASNFKFYFISLIVLCFAILWYVYISN